MNLQYELWFHHFLILLVFQLQISQELISQEEISNTRKISESEIRYLFRGRFQGKVKYFTPQISDNLTTGTHGG